MRLATVAVIASLSISAPAAAQISGSPLSLGVAAGAAVPAGGFADGMNTGFDVTGSVGLRVPVLPLGARIELSYNNFTVQQSQLTAMVNGASARSLGIIGNLLYTLPVPSTLVHPYVIGGVGLYNDKIAERSGSFTESVNENELGVNGGLGVRLSLGRITPFAEARYHRIRVGHKVQGGGTATAISYVPITFGVSF